MPKNDDFVDFVLQHMGPLGGTRARAMFGGYGIYRGDTIFAIVADDGLYFKADDATRGEFTARGLKPFTYRARGKNINLQYYEAPPEVFEEPEAMLRWARQAIETSLRAQKKGAKR